MAERVHILNQYAWPDDSPPAIYAAQVAEAVNKRGFDAVLVAGTGSYRAARRPKPRVPIVHVQHHVGVRGDLASTLKEYESVRRAFERYVRDNVQPGDLVVATSAPPTTPWLLRSIRARRAKAIYWLQDFYPELVRGVVDYPAPARRLASLAFRRALEGWDRVVKIGENLGYHAPNAVVIRNWNTLDLGAPRPFVPKTALYSGNLGYGHDLRLFVEGCRTLLDAGYSLTIRADGPGKARLPGWIPTSPLLTDADELIRSYWEAEVHLVAGDPRIEHAIFPSKVWNAIVAGRRLVATGFGPVMRRELEASLASDPRTHLGSFVRLIEEVAGGR
jgi:hypothetical protein